MHSLRCLSCIHHSISFDNSVEDKQMQLAYGIDMMFREILPNLAHGNDGLIFTSIEEEYVCGTDEHMYYSLSFIP